VCRRGCTRRSGYGDSADSLEVPAPPELKDGGLLPARPLPCAAVRAIRLRRCCPRVPRSCRWAKAGPTGLGCGMTSTQIEYRHATALMANALDEAVRGWAACAPGSPRQALRCRSASTRRWAARGAVRPRKRQSVRPRRAPRAAIRAQVPACSCARRWQQLREVIADADELKYLIHDRDSIFARHLDDSIRALGVAVLRSPVSSPKANSICERVVGTIRRECLEWMIPLSEVHLRSIPREWVVHYNGGRPHSALGPGVPGPPARSARTSKAEPRCRWTPGALVRAKSVLGGLHHEYSL
jgi:hypothetical protein